MEIASRPIACRAILHPLVFALAAIGLTASGCDKSESSARATLDPVRQDGVRGTSAVRLDQAAAGGEQRTDPPRLSASDILGRMVQAYHVARSYADDAQLRIAIRRDGQSPGDPDPLHASVLFARPNKLHVEYFDARMTVDGKKIRASVSSVPQQVLELDAPEKLGISNLFLGEAFNESLSNGPSGFPIQFVLLLDDNALAAILPDGATGEVLPRATFDGHDCLRVKVQTPAGPCTYWIDDTSYVLRLLELPTDSLRQQMEATEGPIKQLSVTLELLGARLNEPVPDVAFQFEIPPDVKLVKQLLRPPQPVSDLLGKAIADFKFAGINGNPMSRTVGGRQGDGPRILVHRLRSVSRDVPAAFESAREIQGLGPRSRSWVLASIGRRSTTRRCRSWPPVGERLSRWLATRTDGFQNAFHGLATPALFVIGPDGTVQYNEVGWNPELASELPTVIDAILADKSTWEDAKRRGDGRMADYERKIQEPPAPVAVVENLPDTKILPRDEPTSLKLSKAWEITELKSPGNFLIVAADGGEPKVLVLDGPRTVVELTREGTIAARHPLQIPEQAVISFLRTTVDSQGHRFYAGSASGQQQVFLFDADWKLLLAFPSADQPKHAGIGDVQFVDLDRSGSPKLAIGYWGLVGVQQISLDGKRLWSDRSMEFVLSLAEGGADSKSASSSSLRQQPRLSRADRRQWNTALGMANSWFDARNSAIIKGWRKRPSRTLRDRQQY